MATVIGHTAHDFIHVAGDGHVAPSGYTDVPDATNSADEIKPGAGEDTVYAGGGDDVINFADHLDGGDQIDGGTGNDTLIADGSASPNTAVQLQMTSVENFVIEGGTQSWIISSTADPLGQTVRVDTVHADSTAQITVNGASAAGALDFVGGGVRYNTFTGGSGNDTFTINSDITFLMALTGNGGDDTFNFNYDPGAQNGGSSIVGNAGNDTVNFNHGLTLNNLSFGLSSVEQINFHRGFDYSLIVTNGTDPIGGSTTINGTHLASGDTMTISAGGNGEGALTIDGGAGDDQVTLGVEGVATVSLGAGNDRIVVAQLAAGDQFDGGVGNDTLVVTTPGDFVLDPTQLKSIDIVQLVALHSYDFTLNPAFIQAGHSLTMDGSNLGAGDTLTFDGSAVTDAHLVLLGGAGDDVLTGGSSFDTMVGGSGNDTFNLGTGGNDTADGDAGDDVFNMGAALTASDRLDGGSGNDTVNLAGNYSLALNGATFAGIETLHMAGGFSYAISINEGTVAAGHTLAVDASDLGAGDVLHFNAIPDTDGYFNITGGAGDDVIAAGGARDVITGGLGADIMKAAAAGHTQFNYTSVAQSTSTGYDTLTNFIDTAHDTIHLPFIPAALAPVVSGGALSTATFDTDLAAAVNAAAMPVGDAVFFEPTSGTLAGHTFLIVDANGVAGYQAGADYVIDFGTGSVAGVTFV
ncbi:MAG TPA: calcium-binding protein [Rhizomicrobium sp.]|jgi:Ca2+-binding RTX toxin-like protein